MYVFGDNCFLVREKWKISHYEHESVSCRGRQTVMRKTPNRKGGEEKGLAVNFRWNMTECS